MKTYLINSNKYYAVSSKKVKNSNRITKKYVTYVYIHDIELFITEILLQR